MATTEMHNLTRANVILLCFGSLADAATYAAFLPTYAQYVLLELALPSWALCVLVVSFVVAGGVGVGIAPLLLRAASTRQVLVGGLLLRVASGALHVLPSFCRLSMVPSSVLACLLASRILHGVGAFTVPLAATYLRINVAEASRVQYFVLAGAAEAVGALVGPAMGSAAAAVVAGWGNDGMEGAPAGASPGYLLLALCIAMFCVLAVAQPGARLPPSALHVVDDDATPWPLVRSALACAFASAFTLLAAAAMLGLLLTDWYALQPNQIFGIYSAVSLAGVRSRVWIEPAPVSRTAGHDAAQHDATALADFRPVLEPRRPQMLAAASYLNLEPVLSRSQLAAIAHALLLTGTTILLTVDRSALGALSTSGPATPPPLAYLSAGLLILVYALTLHVSLVYGSLNTIAELHPQGPGHPDAARLQALWTVRFLEWAQAGRTMGPLVALLLYTVSVGGHPSSLPDEGFVGGPPPRGLACAPPTAADAPSARSRQLSAAASLTALQVTTVVSAAGSLLPWFHWRAVYRPFQDASANDGSLTARLAVAVRREVSSAAASAARPQLRSLLNYGMLLIAVLAATVYEVSGLRCLRLPTPARHPGPPTLNLACASLLSSVAGAALPVLLRPVRRPRIPARSRLPTPHMVIARTTIAHGFCPLSSTRLAARLHQRGAACGAGDARAGRIRRCAPAVRHALALPDGGP